VDRVNNESGRKQKALREVPGEDDVQELREGVRSAIILNAAFYQEK
jgi:hypothetical protein